MTYFLGQAARPSSFVLSFANRSARSARGERPVKWFRRLLVPSLEGDQPLLEFKQEVKSFGVTTLRWTIEK